MTDTKEFDRVEARREWHEIVKRLDALHDEAWSIQTVQNRRQTEIWLEVQRLRARITDLVSAGATF